MDNTLVKVFISYAHESDEFRESVKELAIWLNKHGKTKVIVTTDHKFENRAPKEGWQVWMANQVSESHIVLVICTEKYIKRFLKQEEPNKGKGVIYEGAIITTQLYNKQLMNDKFIPIIPEGGNADHVPEILQPFFNYLSFPKQNNKILKSILNDNPSLEPMDDEDIKGNILTNQDICELEEEIIVAITEAPQLKKETMLPSIHDLVRSFLLLSDSQKIRISKNLSLFKDEYLKMPPSDRDKLLFRDIKENNLLKNLWDEVNKIKPFPINNNPFNNE